MPDARSDGSLLPITSLAVLAVALFGGVFVQGQLESKRPVKELTTSLSLPGGEDIDARLWQDPFQAIRDFEQALADRALWNSQQTSDRLGRDIQRRLHDDHDHDHGEHACQVLFLPVMVPGGPYAEDAEKRRRQRIAVVYALAEEGFVPERSDSIGALRYFPDREEGEPRVATPVPYEWFQYDKLRRSERGEHAVQHVLVLWLQEKVFGDLPARRARTLVATALAAGLGEPREALTDEDRDMLAQVRVELVGPSNSGSLEALIREQLAARAERAELENCTATRRVAASLLDAARLLTPETLGLPAGAALPSAKELCTDLERRLRDASLVLDDLDRGGLSELHAQQFARSLFALTGGDSGGEVPENLKWIASLVAEDPETVEVAVRSADLLGTAHQDFIAQQAMPRNQALQGIDDRDLREWKFRERVLLGEQFPETKGKFEPNIDLRSSDMPQDVLKIFAGREGPPTGSENVAPDPDADPEDSVEEDAGKVRAFSEFLFFRNTIRSKLALGVHSTRATVPQALLFPRGGEHARLAAVLADQEEVGFTSYVCDDHDLAQALVRELDLRGLSPADDRCHIALVGESDTPYGRAHALSLEAAILGYADEQAGRPRAANLTDVLAGERALSERIHRFGYLRGLDGVISVNARPASSSRDAQPEDLAGVLLAPDPAAAEVPFGNNQFDQLHRIADQIEALDRRLPWRESVRAIGVVGSDIYDKLLVLQALRPRFPDKVFFTTDLDARLLHSSEQSWARNTVVASSYGLQLRGDLQGNVPAFRDVYQTATFLAVRSALHEEPLLDPKEDLRAHLFEVGRNGAVPLKLEGAEPPLSPDVPPGFTRVELVQMAVLFGILGIGSFVFFSRRNWRRTIGLADDTAVGSPAATIAWVLWIALAAWFAHLLWRSVSEPEMEPVTLLNGVSVWPAELARLVVVALSIAFLMYAAARLRVVADQIEVRFFGSPGETAGAKKAPCGIRSYPAQDEPAEEATLSALWAHYKRLGKSTCRFRRIAVWIALIGSLGCVLLWASDNARAPLRGGDLLLLDRVLTVLSVFGVTALALFVMDATRLAIVFARDLASGEHTSPVIDRVKEAAALRGLKPDHMAEYNRIIAVADRSGAVGVLLVLPFIVMALLMLGRSPIFDSWTWQLYSAPLVALMALVALVYGALLRKEAGRARRACLERMRLALSRMRAESSGFVDPYEMLIEEAEGLRTGAFSPLSRNPVLAAILVPSGGLTLMTLAELIVTYTN